MRYVLYGLLIYFLIWLLYNVIIPVYKTTKQVKKQFSDLNERMNDQTDLNPKAGNNQPPDKVKSGVGEYIDFEEVK